MNKPGKMMLGENKDEAKNSETFSKEKFKTDHFFTK